MATIKTSIDLSSIISKATDKASKAESSKYDDEILDSQIKAAEERIKSAETQVTKYDLEKAEIQDKLSPPPTKEVSGQGKKGNTTTTVVDEREKDRLEATLRASDVQLSQAKSAVDAARAEAESLKAEQAGNAGLSVQQQQEMNSLLEQVNQLKAEAQDPQKNLTGEEYQNKLKGAVEKADALSGSLPDSGDTVVKDFWTSIAQGFKDINSSITEFLTPDPAEIKTADNYSGYFEDVEQGYDGLIGYLGDIGADRAVVTEVRNGRDSILNERTTYLGGMTADDNLVLQEHLTHLNTMIEKINSGQDLTNDDIAKLSLGSAQASSVLTGGGEAFTDVIAIPFNTIALNMNELSEKIDDPAFDEMFTTMQIMYAHPKNNLEDLQGITLNEVNEIYDYSDLITNLKNKDSISSSELQQVLDDGNSFINNLSQNYGFTTTTSSSSSTSGSIGNSRVGIGSGRRY